MRRKNIAAPVLCVIIILLLTGCSQPAEESNVAGKTYIYMNRKAAAGILQLQLKKTVLSSIMKVI